jgi:hypothetical protein
MPTKWKKDGIQWLGGPQSRVSKPLKFFIKNAPSSELEELANTPRKELHFPNRKRRGKALNELARRDKIRRRYQAKING